jgi:hypothetical protein
LRSPKVRTTGPGDDASPTDADDVDVATAVGLTMSHQIPATLKTFSSPLCMTKLAMTRHDPEFVFLPGRMFLEVYFAPSAFQTACAFSKSQSAVGSGDVDAAALAMSMFTGGSGDVDSVFKLGGSGDADSMFMGSGDVVSVFSGWNTAAFFLDGGLNIVNSVVAADSEIITSLLSLLRDFWTRFLATTKHCVLVSMHGAMHHTHNKHSHTHTHIPTLIGWETPTHTQTHTHTHTHIHTMLGDQHVCLMLCSLDLI